MPKKGNSPVISIYVESSPPLNPSSVYDFFNADFSHLKLKAFFTLASRRWIIN